MAATKTELKLHTSANQSENIKLRLASSIVAEEGDCNRPNLPRDGNAEKNESTNESDHSLLVTQGLDLFALATKINCSASLLDSTSQSPKAAVVVRNISNGSSSTSPLDQLAEIASLEVPSSTFAATSSPRSVIKTTSKTGMKYPDHSISSSVTFGDTVHHRILENDVLCGRGGLTNHHSGNVKFRQLVRSMQPSYLLACKRDKSKIAKLIVETIRTKFDPPGRFLRRQDSLADVGTGDSGTWIDIGDQKAREKTSQALREGAPDLREGAATLNFAGCDIYTKKLKTDDTRGSGSAISTGYPSTTLMEEDGDTSFAVRKEHLEYMQLQYLKILAQSDGINEGGRNNERSTSNKVQKKNLHNSGVVAPV